MTLLAVSLALSPALALQNPPPPAPHAVWAEYVVCDFILSAGKSRQEAEARAAKEEEWSHLWTEWSFSASKPNYVAGEVPTFDWWRQASVVRPADEGANPKPPSDAPSYFVRALPVARGEYTYPIWRVRKEAYLWYERGADAAAAAKAVEDRFLKRDKAPWMVLLRFRTGEGRAILAASPQRG
jgi:hypothetical protein